eukprot:365013-Chlamydomonas_euryale.AAC.6
MPRREKLRGCLRFAAAAMAVLRLFMAVCKQGGNHGLDLGVACTEAEVLSLCPGRGPSRGRGWSWGWGWASDIGGDDSGDGDSISRGLLRPAAHLLAACSEACSAQQLTCWQHAVWLAPPSSSPAVGTQLCCVLLAGQRQGRP